jgi:PAS domain S-box-containing protein
LKARISIWPDVVAGGYAAAFLVWLVVPGQSRATRELIATLAFLPPGLAVAWMTARTARLWSYDRATKRAWALLACGLFVYWLSCTVSNGLERYAPALAFTSRVETLAFASSDRSARARHLLDLTLIFVGCLLGAWYFSFLPVVSRQGSLSDALASSLFFPTADLVIIAITGVAVLTAAHPTTRRALVWVFAARLVRLSATVSFSLVRAHDGYRPGNWVDALWFCAWICAWIAARIPQHRLASGATTGELEQARTYRSGGQPLLAVIFAQALVLWLLRGELRAPAGFVAIAATVITGLIALRQITELRENGRLRELERRQEARFRSLVQRGSDVVLVIGRDGELLYRSPSAERLFPGERRFLRDLFDAADAAALSNLIAQAERGQASPAQPVRVAAAGGKVAHLEFLAADLRHDPAVAGVALTGRDVTERHLLTEELQRTEKLRSVGQTAGGIAHDLNNILFVVRGNATLLLEELPEESPLRADVGEIGRATDRAVAVTRKLLEFSRREAARAVTVNLNLVVAELEPMLRQFISAGIEVRIGYAKEPAWLVVDQRQLEQVVLNLSMNARDAMPGGGRLELQVGETGAEVSLSIEDSGVGMDEATRSRIFEPFFTTKPLGQGTGLSLASAYGIVTSAGGRLEVASVPGKGTTFTVVFPRAQPPSAIAAIAS